MSSPSRARTRADEARRAKVTAAGNDPRRRVAAAFDAWRATVADLADDDDRAEAYERMTNFLLNDAEDL